MNKSQIYKLYGQEHTLKEWAEISGVRYKTLMNRLRNVDFDLEKAIFYDQNHSTASMTASYAIKLMRDKYLKKREEAFRRMVKGSDFWKETKFVVTGSGSGYWAPVDYEEWYSHEKSRRIEWDHEYAMDTYKVRNTKKR